MNAIVHVGLVINQSSSNNEMIDKNKAQPVKPTSRTLTSEKLFGDSNEVVIKHQNESYVLRLTKQNKLILTK